MENQKGNISQQAIIREMICWAPLTISDNVALIVKSVSLVSQWEPLLP